MHETKAQTTAIPPFRGRIDLKTFAFVRIEVAQRAIAGMCQTVNPDLSTGN